MCWWEQGKKGWTLRWHCLIHLGLVGTIHPFYLLHIRRMQMEVCKRVHIDIDATVRKAKLHFFSVCICLRRSNLPLCSKQEIKMLGLLFTGRQDIIMLIIFKKIFFVTNWDVFPIEAFYRLIKARFG